MISTPFIVISALLQTAFNPGLPNKFSPPTPKGTDVVATVNGQPIFAKDVEAVLWEWRGPEVSEDLVSLAMIRQSAAKAGITTNQPEIEAKLKENLKAYDAQRHANPQDPTAGQTAQEVLLAQGFPMSRLYIRSEFEVLLDKLANRSFDPATFVKVSTLLIRTDDATAKSIAKAAQAADVAFKRLQNGATWAVVMKANGAPPEQVQTGGLLGWRSVTVFPQSIQKTLLALAPGKFTAPVQTPAGFQIFKVDSQGTKATGSDLDELKKLYTQRQRGQILTDLRKDAKVERFPTKEPSQ